jgi:hypothetical protein
MPPDGAALTIAFSRSGGIAVAPSLRVSALAALARDGGSVTAAGYSRTIDGEEAAALASDAREAAEESAAGGVRRRMPDAFRYAFTITSGDVSTTLAASDGEEMSPALTRLVAWARAECAAIVSARSG